MRAQSRRQAEQGGRAAGSPTKFKGTAVEVRHENQPIENVSRFSILNRKCLKGWVGARSRTPDLYRVNEPRLINRITYKTPVAP